MRYTHPRQNQKARVVGDEPDVALPRFRAPADIAITATQMARGARPGGTGDRPDSKGALRPHQILQVLPYRLLVAKIMMLLQQAIEYVFLSGAPHLLKLDGLLSAPAGLPEVPCRS